MLSGRGIFCLVSGGLDRRGLCGLKHDLPCVTPGATNEGNISGGYIQVFLCMFVFVFVLREDFPSC